LVATENAQGVAGVQPANAEPVETIAEAALRSCSTDPKTLTGRVAYGLSLLVERELV
jgi:hypothetical protein